jgi:hypothetical protein
LSHLHAMLKRRPAPASLFLDRTLQGGGWSREESKAGKRAKLYTVCLTVYWKGLVSHSLGCEIMLQIEQDFEILIKTKIYTVTCENNVLKRK